MKCNFCSSEENVQVSSSSVGPVSTAMCKTCIDNNAESYGAFIMHEALVQFLKENKPDEPMLELTCYIDGEYVKWKNL